MTPLHELVAAQAQEVAGAHIGQWVVVRKPETVTAVPNDLLAAELDCFCG